MVSAEVSDNISIFGQSVEYYGITGKRQNKPFSTTRKERSAYKTNTMTALLLEEPTATLRKWTIISVRNQDNATC